MFDSLLSRHGLSIDRLHNFLRVAEAGSIADAADRDPSRQSLFSRQIRELEEFFGAQLTRRVGHGLEITEAGEELAVIIRSQFSALEAFAAKAHDIRRTLTVGAGASVVEWLLAPSLGEWSEILGPRFDWKLSNVRSAEGVEQLRTGKLDFLVVRDDALKNCPKTIHHVALAGFGYKLFVPRGKSPQRLPMAILASGGQLAKATHDLLNAGKVKASGRTVECTSLIQVASLISSGTACGILPEIAHTAFADRLSRASVESFALPTKKPYRRQLVLAWNSRSLETRGIRSVSVTRMADALSLNFPQ
ncbi:LysR family transcriptional regulator [Sulfuriroseicoccus oceanibius]|uniref:LysR family transcriptional regulator n=1 Tax=Sulfuriroseicoccus oceanibius TaxID=2707525 RepID=A0A6B3L5H8_9BACT|nr:LysR family transcriptional regulator [Sulfuriroseicoccus oceanibius]QQL45334.1 LysR family transcriptional regulator [Sulfuriroseicoccus oceanibius]